MRIVSATPLYWKARNLDVFNGSSWTAALGPGRRRGDEPFERRPPRRLGGQRRRGRARSRSASAACGSRDVIGAGTIVDVRDPSRNVQPAHLARQLGRARAALRRGDSYTAEVHVPRADAGALARGDLRRERAPGRRARAHGAVQAGRDRAVRRRREHHRERAARPGRPRPRCTSAPGTAPARSTPPTRPLRRSEFDVDTVMERSQYERTWALSKRLKRGTEYPMDYVRAVDDYLSRPEFRYVERPAQPPAGQAPLDYFLNQTHEGYCQHYAGAMALLLRMGGISARVATGFSPGGYSSRKKAWIVRDTDAHAWVEVWFDKYGWVTIDPTPDATPARCQVAALAPAAGRRAAGCRGRHRRRRRRANTERPNPQRPPGAAGRRRRRASTPPPTRAALRWWVWRARACSRVGALVLAVLLFLRRPRGNTPMDRAIAEVEDALRRVGRPVTTGTTLTQLERRLGSHSPEVSAYLRALAAGRYAPVARRRRRAPAAARCAARSPRASGSAPARARCGRCRRGSSARRASGRGRSRSTRPSRARASVASWTSRIVGAGRPAPLKKGGRVQRERRCASRCESIIATRGCVHEGNCGVTQRTHPHRPRSRVSEHARSARQRDSLTIPTSHGAATSHTLRARARSAAAAPGRPLAQPRSANAPQPRRTSSR